MAKEIVDCKVYIKVTGKPDIQWDKISLCAWCEHNKFDYIVQNKLILMFVEYRLWKLGEWNYKE